MKGPLPFLLALGALTLSACIIPSQVEIFEKEQRQLRTESATGRSEFDSIRSAVADTRANLDQVQRDLNALKEQVEEVRYQADRQVGRTSREGDQRIKEMEARLAKVSEDLKMQGALLKAREDELRALREAWLAKAAEKETAAAAPAGERAQERGSAEPETVKRDYEEAWRFLERKEYRAAIPRFKDFLKKHSNSDYADNAQYWIGECYYALKEFDQAILEFDAVRRKYPKGRKVPAALLKQGFAFAELGDKVDARLILQELVDRYPQSEEALKAKQKLNALGS